MIPTLFFVGCQVWSKGITSISCFLLVARTLGCTQSMCVFIGITPLHLYFISPFLIIEQFSFKTFSLAFSNLQIMHLWVHNVNKEVIINSKKTLANWWTMVRLPPCSFNFYSYKLHSFYYYCHITKCQITNHHAFNIWTITNNIWCCRIKEIGINHAHTFNNINTMQLPFLSFNHCTMKTLHPTLQDHKLQRGNIAAMVIIRYLTLVVAVAFA